MTSHKFFDIFSKRKIEDKPKETIIIDYREKNSLVPSELVNLDINIIFQQLEIADYLIKDIAVERKTISDFKSSIINKRIMQQLTALKEYKKHLLILEGIEEQDIYSGIIHENAFRGFLLSAALEFQIPIIFTKNAKDTAKYLAVLAKKKEKADFSLRFKRQTESKEEQVQFILEGFPGVGPATAKKLINRFGSIKNIINASQEELKEILGNKTKDFLNLIDD